jgi:hypothetical protein
MLAHSSPDANASVFPTAISRRSSLWSTTAFEVQTNRVGNTALVLSSIGLISLVVFNNEPLGWLMPWSVLSCPIGVILGIFAIRHRPRRSAAWAIAIGVWGSLYVSTVWLFFILAA